MDRFLPGGRGRPTNRWIVWAVAAGLLCSPAACSSPDLSEERANFRVQPEELRFPETFIGYPIVGMKVRLSNGSRRAHAFTVETEAPFSVEPSGEQSIGGTSERDLVVWFSPRERGAVEGLLRIKLETGERLIRLYGTGLEPSGCPSADPCVERHFDPVEARCVEVRLEDETPCEIGDACHKDTVCIGGKCVGERVRCEVPDKCHVGTCDPLTGCQLSPVICDKPENPCLLSRCDPSKGCVEETKPDLTSCGRQGCVERDLCIDGQCQPYTELEGFSCGHPCGDGAVCKNKVCTREEGTALTASWSHPPEGEAGRTIVFHGVVDEAGTLSWIECDEGDRCEVVSAQPDGSIVGQQQVPLQGGGEGAEMLLADRWLVVHHGGKIFFVERAGDEPVRWVSIENLVDFGPGPTLHDLVHLGSGNLAFLLSGSSGNWGVGALSAFNGRASWIKSFWDGSAPGQLVADELGNLYFPRRQSGKSRLQSLDKGGNVRWDVPMADPVEVLAAYAGLVFARTGTELIARYANDGKEAWRRVQATDDLVAALRRGFATEVTGEGARVLSIDWNGGGTLGKFEIGEASAISPLTLAQDDRATLLVEKGGAEKGWWLEEIGAKAERVWRCSIPEESVVADRWALLPTFGVEGDAPRLVVFSGEGRIRTYLAPAQQVARSGWSTSRGSQAREGRPR